MDLPGFDKKAPDLCAPPFSPSWFEEVHGRADYQFPQLELVRPHLEDLPQLVLPPGYTLRHYRPGDEEHWGRIMTEAFIPFWDAERFRRFFLPHFGFRPERVIMVCREEEPVGSASAFQWPGLPRRQGFIHMVGVKREHCGKRLGYWLTVACLRQFKKEGFTSAMLQTEDFRLPAIKHYLRLGFRPVLVREDQREKWKQVLERLGPPENLLDLQLDSLPVMNRFAFWWRTVRIILYMRWLNLKADFLASPAVPRPPAADPQDTRT